MTSLLIAEAISITTTLMYPLMSFSANLFFSLKFLTSLGTDDTELQALTSRLSDTLDDVSVIKKFIENESERLETDISLKMCLENLNKSLSELEDITLLLTKKIERHKKKWFSTYRRYNISKEKILLHAVLDKVSRKFDMLTKIISIKHNDKFLDLTQYEY